MENVGRKARKITLIRRCFDIGLKSPTLIGELLGISKVEAWRVLTLFERRGKPRENLDDVLGGLPPDLRADIQAFREQRGFCVTALPESSADATTLS